MISIEPNTTSPTTKMPKASARKLLVSPGPLEMWKKNTTCTPIWPIASAASNTGTAGPHTVFVSAAQNDASVRMMAKKNPVAYASTPLRPRDPPPGALSRESCSWAISALPGRRW